ncbi:MAG: hypothetical protein OIF34_11615, partial [Porticoccaceae bacterium]|nr:hypothetical protein [Porticoccaceae bacterium]
MDNQNDVLLAAVSAAGNQHSVNWKQRAEQRYRQLCPEARALLDCERWPFNRNTSLAYLELAHFLATSGRDSQPPLLVGISGG